ncbi:MAG: (2Fe-2S)-binding protein [Nitrospirae bacterium]|nr:MAG: (2Fe-2S)-binding protein [Nitrospirota bacterium]
MIKLNINGKVYNIEADPDTPLLWIIREHLQLYGTKYGCGIGLCGACTIHINGRAERSCQISAIDAVDKKITTIEGIPEDHPVKRIWIDKQVPQCGYCQPGQIMQAISIFAEHPKADESLILKKMSRNICRCGTYPRIKKAMLALIKK